MHQQQQTSTGKPIPKEELWASMSAANQAGKPAAQVPAEAIKAAISPQSENEVPTSAHASNESALVGSTSTPVRNDDEVIASLAAMKPMEYERTRLEQAKRMGCRPAVLDELVKKARGESDQENNTLFPSVEPHPEPVEPAALLNEIVGTIRRHIVLSDAQAYAAALWITMTWFISIILVAPLALINAPEKSCGKTQLLDMIGRLSANYLFAANITAAVLFRLIERCSPTICIDEVDTFINQNDALKGIINAGHTRTSAYVWRIVGENHEPKSFSVWAAKALAGIRLEKHLPDSTMSRGIVFNLRRKMAHETVERLRHADNEAFELLASKLARFALDYAEQVRRARPPIPEQLSDRAQDNWEPLLAIAQCAGPEWLQRATDAAIELSGVTDTSISTGNELLSDIQHVFEKKKATKISTVDLIEALCTDEEAAWATYNRGKPLTPRQLARQLTAYGISSKTVRLGHANTPKGFDTAQFADAFARYLAAPEKLPQHRNVSPESMSGMETGVAGTNRVAATGGSGATPKPSLGLDCGEFEDDLSTTPESPEERWKRLGLKYTEADF